MNAILPSVLSFAFIGSALTAQEPQPKPKPDRVEFALLAADAGVRALDVYSTHQMLQNGNHEMFLPGFVAKNPPVMAVGFAGIVGLNYFAARKLERHGHHQMARIVLMVDIAQDAPWAVHNLYLPKHKRP